MAPFLAEQAQTRLAVPTPKATAATRARECVRCDVASHGPLQDLFKPEGIYRLYEMRIEASRLGERSILGLSVCGERYRPQRSAARWLYQRMIPVGASHTQTAVGS